jgi:hypothetical protein
LGALIGVCPKAASGMIASAESSANLARRLPVTNLFIISFPPLSDIL